MNSVIIKPLSKGIPPSEEKKELTVLTYKNVKGRKIFLANGNPMKEVSKHFYPKTEEELELCQYFESIGNIVKVK